MKTFFKKQVFKTNKYLYIFFAILVELLLFLTIGGLSYYLAKNGHNMLGEIVSQLWWIMTGVPFIFLNHYKKEVEKEHKTKRIAFEFDHLADGVIGKKGINEISFEKIENSK